jgi:hypothetical protein
MAPEPQLSYAACCDAATQRLVQQRVQQPGCNTLRFGACRRTAELGLELRMRVGAPLCRGRCGRGDSNPHALAGTSS